MTFPIDQIRTRRDAVADMTVAGYTVREIANRLDCSTQSVYYHLKRLDLKPGNGHPTDDGGDR